MLRMSSVLVAVFNRRATGEAVRTALVKDGFPTDRVELTSGEELGRAALMPMSGVDEKLKAYFGTLFNGVEGVRWASTFQRAVSDGKAVIAVQPRGEIEVKRALEILNEAAPEEMRAKDLDNQAFEHAATETETPIFTWIGKVLAAPGAPDTTGLAELP
jgi:hypothetical protein